MKIPFNIKLKHAFLGKENLGLIKAYVTTFIIYLSFNILSITHSNSVFYHHMINI